ncbi:dihydrodipicolinate synthase family protein [Gehongia tenuis]|uniref:Dihydrodipicolinate synthase family protein n=1 Tax=Gehongia tenuis TaxID=2763655 RepID=A0A926D5Z1_9FIRM|nr:dihydrodipicolinate synthase family protein [Gehongia tenuis]MBC8532014.1 dihydrodipicolinate synthase family protein [Gehongia tenuis]
MSFQPKGIIPPIITPFTEDDAIHEPVLRRLVNHFIDEGVHGLFPMGTTGEFYAVTDDEYKRVLEITVEETCGRVPVYAGANHITTRGAVRLAHIAESAGVNAISVLTPMFIGQTQEELYHYFKTIAESTPLPIILYNNKPKTNVTIAPETAARLGEIPNIVGVKDSTGDFTNTEEYLRLTRGNPNFSVLLGRDTLIHAGLCYGAAGAIASCANVAPRLTADIYDKYVAGDIKGSLEAQFKLAPLRIACNMGTFPAVIKEGLMMQGFPVGKCLDPIAELTDGEKAKLRMILQEMDLLSKEGTL